MLNLKLPVLKRTQPEPLSKENETLCAVLKWAAGAAIDVSRIGAIDEAKLLDLITQHRLQVRFLDRVQRERPAWCSPNLTLRLIEQRAQAHVRFNKQLATLREICAYDNQPLILNKGFSTYALTGNSYAMRWSGDLDIYCADPEHLYQTLVKLGYSGEQFDENLPPAGHFARMERGDSIVEIHRFYPVLSYPKEVGATDLVPARNPGRWVQNFTSRKETSRTDKKIGYRCFRENSLPGTTAETRHLLFADANLSILVLCAHEMRTMIDDPSCHKALPVRLGELANILDLTRHQSFDKKRFLDLMEEFNGHDAVQMMDGLLRSYFGVNPLSLSSPPRWGENCFPRIPVWWLPCYVSLYDSADDLLLPMLMEMDKVIKRLGANTVTATTGSRRKVYTALAYGEGEPLDRVLVQAARNGQDKQVPFQLSIAWAEQGLSFEVSILQPLEDNYGYHIQVNDGYPCEIFTHVNLYSHGTEWNLNGADNASLHLTEKGAKVRLLVPWEILPASVRATGAHYTLFRLVKWNRHHTAHFEYSNRHIIDFTDPWILIPLHIVRG